jgi:hypothetical protein
MVISLTFSNTSCVPLITDYPKASIILDVSARAPEASLRATTARNMSDRISVFHLIRRLSSSDKVLIDSGPAEEGVEEATRWRLARTGSGLELSPLRLGRFTLQVNPERHELTLSSGQDLNWTFMDPMFLASGFQ